ncbi:MAG: hypothetical protein ACI8W8_003380, partial [Rhodothermales bacterium]
MKTGMIGIVGLALFALFVGCGNKGEEKAQDKAKPAQDTKDGGLDSG